MQVKAEWAFRVFDFDGDGKLNKDDIYKTVSALTDQTEQGEDRESKEKLETEKVFLQHLIFLLLLLCFTEGSCQECTGGDRPQWLGFHLLGGIQAAGDEIT